MGLFRVVQNTSREIRHRFVPVDQGIRLGDDGTVRIVRSDATEATPVPVATRSTPDSDYVFTLTPAHTGLLDTLTATWTVTIDGEVQTLSDTIEIAGDVLFSIDDARTALGDPAYDESLIRQARIYAETELERGVGFALVPRYGEFRLAGNGSPSLLLPPFTRAVRWIQGGTTVGTLTYDGGDVLTNLSGWAPGIGNVTVGVEHGMDVGNELIPGARRQALALAVEYLGGGVGTVDPRAERLITDDGTIVYGSASAGQFRATGVNEWVAANRLPVIA